MSDNVVRLNIVVSGPLPPFACVRGTSELAVGPWPDERSPAAIVVARVHQVVSVDAWETLFSLCLNDGREWPAYRAAVEAVRRWGGRVLVEDPSTAEA